RRHTSSYGDWSSDVCSSDLYASLDEVLAQADFISLHPAMKPETRHLIGERELALMKPTAFLVNTSRGPVIDEAALVRALAERRKIGRASCRERVVTSVGARS